MVPLLCVVAYLEHFSMATVCMMLLQLQSTGIGSVVQQLPWMLHHYGVHDAAGIRSREFM